jgi:hypothetical protein
MVNPHIYYRDTEHEGKSHARDGYLHVRTTAFTPYMDGYQVHLPIQCCGVLLTLPLLCHDADSSVIFHKSCGVSFDATIVYNVHFDQI